MHSLRRPAALSQDLLVDKRRAGFGPPHLSGRGLSPGEPRAASELRAGPRRAILGTCAAAGSPTTTLAQAGVGLRANRRGSEHQHAPEGGADTGEPTDPMAHWDRLFEQNETGETGNPKEVHDAAEEQEAHQEPAASQAIGAVLEPHAKGAAWARPPLLGEEGERRAAVPQAHAFDRGELPCAGGDED